MIAKRIAVCLLFASLCSLSCFATCANQGSRLSGGSSSSSLGGQATLFQQGNVGCYIVVDGITAVLTQQNGSAATGDLGMWPNTTCTGTPTWTLAAISVTATSGNTSVWTFGGSTIRGTIGGDVCIGFSSSLTGVIQSVAWGGYETATDTNANRF